MAGFTAPSATPKARTGKANRPKKTAEDTTGLSAAPRQYPITDDFASHEIPGFATRRKNTNNKSGFNTTPGCPPSARLAQPPPYDPCRGYGREVGRDENESSADTATANKTKLVHEQGKNPGVEQIMSNMVGRKSGGMGSPIKKRGGLAGMAIGGAKKLFGLG